MNFIDFYEIIAYFLTDDAFQKIICKKNSIFQPQKNAKKKCGEKNVKFENFCRNNYIFTKPIAKMCTFQKIKWKKKKMLQQNKCVFSQPI